jgi:hypothetical protein
MFSRNKAVEGDKQMEGKEEGVALSLETRMTWAGSPWIHRGLSLECPVPLVSCPSQGLGSSCVSINCSHLDALRGRGANEGGRGKYKLQAFGMLDSATCWRECAWTKISVLPDISSILSRQRISNTPQDHASGLSVMRMKQARSTRSLAQHLEQACMKQARILGTNTERESTKTAPCCLHERHVHDERDANARWTPLIWSTRLCSHSPCSEEAPPAALALERHVVLVNEVVDSVGALGHGRQICCLRERAHTHTRVMVARYVACASAS